MSYGVKERRPKSLIGSDDGMRTPAQRDRYRVDPCAHKRVYPEYTRCIAAHGYGVPARGLMKCCGADETILDREHGGIVKLDEGRSWRAYGC